MLTADTLYLDFESKIHGYISRRLDDHESIRDLTAQTFYKATEALSTGKGPRVSVSGWLYRIAYNLIIDYYRHRDRCPTSYLDDHHDLCDGLDPALEVEQIERKAMLQRAMRLLSPGQCRVIQMRYLEGYKFAEIADVMGITEGAVKALQHRALVNLRTVMVNHEQ